MPELEGKETMHLLYMRKSTDVRIAPEDSLIEINLKVFTPSLFGGVFLNGEKRNLKTACVRLLFYLMTFGKAQIYYVDCGNDIIHTSYAIPSCAKFQFMKRNDLEIGPCYTHPASRGRGIYPKVLSEICRLRCNDTATFYMIVDEKNTSSIKGIEKAGFVRCGLVQKSKISKRYVLV